MDIGNFINAGLLLLALIAIVMTYRQSRSAARTERASFLKDLYSTLTSDLEISQAYYLVEYGRFTYEPSFHGSELEPQMDRLLSFADLVCELHDQRVISSREMEFFEYRFARIASDPGIRSYLEFLAGYYKSVGIDKEPFHSYAKFSRGYALKRGEFNAA